VFNTRLKHLNECVLSGTWANSIAKFALSLWRCPQAKEQIYTPACYSALWHIGLLGCIWLLCDGYAPNFFMPRNAFRTITIIAGDNDCNEFTSPMFCYGTQKTL